MSGARDSVLAQKIARAKRAAPAASDLTEFATAIGKAAEEAACELLSAPIMARVESSEAALPAALANAPDPGVYYWLLGDGAAPDVLLTLSPGFAAAATERLLGGALGAASPEAALSVLDHEMGGVLVDVLIRTINRVVAKRSGPVAQRAQLTGKRGARAPAAAFAGLDPTRSFAVTINLAYEEHEAAAAISLYFSAAYLDRAKIRSTAQPQKSSPAASVEWASRLRNNVLYTKLPLSAVLGRVRTNVGALSRLKAGDVFDLEPDAVNSLEIAATTTSGPAVVARARLGAYQSNKAIKLTSPVNPDFIRDL